MKLFDQNGDGFLDLQDMARLVNVSENFLLQFKIQVSRAGLSNMFVKPYPELFVNASFHLSVLTSNFKGVHKSPVWTFHGNWRSALALKSIPCHLFILIFRLLPKKCSIVHSYHLCLVSDWQSLTPLVRNFSFWKNSKKFVILVEIYKITSLKLLPRIYLNLSLTAIFMDGQWIDNVILLI